MLIRRRHRARLRDRVRAVGKHRKLLVESLESRRVLASYIWDGGGDGTSWSDADNWDVGGSNPSVPPGKTDGVPDDVTINLAGTYTVTLDVDIVDDAAGDPLSTFTLNASGATFSADGHTLTVNGSSNISNGTVLWQGSIWAGTGTLTNDAAMTIQAFSTISSGFVQNGTVNIEATPSLSTTLTVSSGLSNSGTIVIEQTGAGSTTNALLTVTTGLLLNSATGVINVTPDTNSSQLNDRAIAASVTNNGVLNINENTEYTQANSVFTNNNDVNIAAGKTFSYNATNAVFNQDGGTLDVGLALGDGAAFTMDGDDFNYDGGVLSGNAPLLISSALNIGAASTGAGEFRMQNAGGTLSGDIAAAQTVRVEATTASSTVTAATGFTNNGSLILEQTGAGSTTNALLTVTTGLLLNSATGVINVTPDTNSSQLNDRAIAASVTNNGVLNINENTEYTQANSVFTNNNDVNIAAGKTFSYNATNAVFNQDGGTLDVGLALGDGAAFTMDGDDFNYDGGVLSGNAPLLISSALNIGAGSIGAGEFRMQNAGGTLSGDIAAAQTVRVEATTANSTVTAATGFTNNGTLILEQTGAGSTANALLTVTTGLLLNSATGVINVTPDTNSSQLNDRAIAASVTNNGVLNINENTEYTQTNSVFTNNNDVNIAAGKTFSYNATNAVFNQDGGTLDLAGTLMMSSDSFNFTGGSIIGGGMATLTNSTLTGAGTAAIDVNVAGADVNPGTSSGILNVVADAGTSTGGDYTQSTGTTLNIEIGGDDPGTGHDQVTIEGAANLSGTINISLTDGFVPDPCQTFELVTFGSRIGTDPSFTGLDLGGGLFFRPVFSPTSLTLVAYNNTSPINVHPTSVNVTEGGATAPYNLCLASATGPTGVVTVTPSPDGQVSVAPTSLSFDPVTNWELPQQMTVTAVDDIVVEGVHTGAIAHSSSSSDSTFNNVSISSVTANITDNDTATFTINDVTVTEGTGTATFTVSLDNPLDIDVAVDVGYTDVTATGSSGGGGADYDNDSDQVTFLAGDTADKMVTVAITDDNIVEATETFTAALSTATALGGRGVNLSDTGTGTIQDDDTATFTINDVTVTEGTGTATFTVSLDNPLDIDVAVDVDYTDVTATGSSGGGGADYDNDSDQVTFLAGDTADKMVTVAITDDNIVEATETFTAALSTATALGGRSVNLTDTGTGTIEDNNTATFTIDDVTVTEGAGTATFTVSLDNPLDIDVAVDVGYTDVTATGSSGGGGADYDNDSDQVTFLAGDTADKMVTVAITDDNIVEATETFTAALSTATALGGRSVNLTDTGTGTIQDDDTATFTINDVTVTERAGTATFTVSLDNPLDIDVAVDVGYTDVTATGSSGAGGADYDNDSDQVTFLAGDTADKMVTVAITDDNIVEATETFTAALSTATALGGRGVNLSDTGTGTIQDDDTGGGGNNDPTVAADGGIVNVDEGQAANNTGTFFDPDQGDDVTVTASIGTISKSPNPGGSGTWSWSVNTEDGPADSQTVIITVSDGNGGSAQTSFQLTVNNVPPTVDSISVPLVPVDINDQPISATGTFSDPAGTNDESYTCTVDYGDGAGALVGTIGGTTCTGPDHTYAEPGVYTVTFAVTDKDGDTGSASPEDFIVIYDADGGFVTGGGWIYSDVGWCQLNAVCAGAEGKANFGFVSKYKKNATVPTGNTEFNFSAGNFNFHSDAYDWLVINQGGANAQFKGAGTINGDSAPTGDLFKFMIWATDGNNKTSTEDDTFRIKIWYEDGGTDVIVYDNGFDQVIGGGNIKVHKGKKKLVVQTDGEKEMVGAVLTQAMLDAAVSEAVAHWAAQGLQPNRLSVLEHLEIQIADLEGPTLGMASSTEDTMWVDWDAAGFGWASDRSSGGVDLLSVIVHELGHVLELEHDALGSTLGVGERHLPVLESISGDANRDGVFDHFDLIQVLRSGKYLTDEPALWAEGDWNGDNFFGQLDIVAALQTRRYLHPAKVDRVFAHVGR